MVKTWKIQKAAAEAGQNTTQYIRRLLADGCTVADIATATGVTANAVYSMFKRLGITDGRERNKPFLYEGVMATMSEHCRRHGINRSSAYRRKCAHGETYQQALNHLRAYKRERETLSGFEYMQGLASNPTKS